MCHDDNAPTLGRFEFGIVRRKVHQIIGRAGYMPQDREDLEHELLARLLKSLKSFDPAKAHRKSFVTAVVERDVANILRDKRAEKRHYCRITSLNVMIEVADDEPVEMAATISSREYNARRCRHPRSDEELAQLVSDLSTVVAKLPDDLRDLADRLRTRTISEIARELKIPRTTLHRTVRRIRERFVQSAMREYL